MQSSVLPSGRDSIFHSYIALAKGLVGELTGACLLDAALVSKGEWGTTSADAATRWIKSLGWNHLKGQPPAARATESHQCWTVIPLQLADGTLLGAFCVGQTVLPAPTDLSHYAKQLARTLQPLSDCIQRDLLAGNSSTARVTQLTADTADLEWLFGATANSRSAGDDRRLIGELLTAAATRLNSALAIVCIPDKRLTIMYENDIQAATILRRAWDQTKTHLMTWVQRQHRPLVVNCVGNGDPQKTRCKVLCVPLIKDPDRVFGTLSFFNSVDGADFLTRHLFLARHIGRQIASLVEAQFDLMTGLYTRTGLDQVFSGLDEESGSAESSILYLDIDHMRVLNELHSFELRNELIVRIADLLTTPLLPADALAARITGDRFAIVLPQSNSAAAVTIAETLRAAASKIIIGPSKETFDTSISCGISSLLPIQDGLARAIAAAEIACKAAKNRGRNRIEVYAFEDASMMRRHADAMAVGQLRAALKTDRLLLYAQRITPLQNKSLAGGYELLLRLREVDGSLVGPGPLIEAAQRYQILPSVDRWVMQRAFQMLAPYRSMLKSRELCMSINVSGQSMGEEAFIQQFTQALTNANLPRNCVSVELTEQAAISNLAHASVIVEHLVTAGCRFALDDFGTGANSLTTLKALQIYRVKIDGSFVRDLLTNRNSRATVQAIVALAKGMGIETVAEYVETMDIAKELTRMGVDYAQGYAFGKPRPLNELLTQLADDESQRLHRLFLET